MKKVITNKNCNCIMFYQSIPMTPPLNDYNTSGLFLRDQADVFSGKVCCVTAVK